MDGYCGRLYSFRLRVGYEHLGNKKENIIYLET